MMIDVKHSIILIVVMLIVNIILRFMPFLIFGGGRETPAVISYLGKYLPPAMIAMLVIYCFKSVSVFSSPHGFPELISVTLIIILHIWKRNTLLSIAIGTACYMVLIQTVFG